MSFFLLLLVPAQHAKFVLGHGVRAVAEEARDLGPLGAEFPMLRHSSMSSAALSGVLLMFGAR
jgi:hypothetical protein